jgi:hypothetical protein
MSIQLRHLGTFLLALLFQGSAFATPFTLATATVSFDGISSFTTSGSSTATLAKTEITTSGLSGATASAFAGAEVGHLRSYVDGDTLTLSGGLTDNLGQNIVARPRSVSRFSDNVTFTSPTMAQNALITVNASLLFDGFLTTTAQAGGLTAVGASEGQSQITVQILGTGLPTNFNLTPFSGFVAAGAKADANFPVGANSSVNVEIPTVVPLVFTARVGAATPIQFVMDMQGFERSFVFRNSAGDLFASATIVGDYSDSLAWGGITSITDGAGNLITNYTALGDDGFNYRNAFAAAVPEPASFILLLSGGLAVLARRRWPAQSAGIGLRTP